MIKNTKASKENLRPQNKQTLDASSKYIHGFKKTGTVPCLSTFLKKKPNNKQRRIVEEKIQSISTWQDFRNSHFQQRIFTDTVPLKILANRKSDKSFSKKSLEHCKERKSIQKASEKNSKDRFSIPINAGKQRQTCKIQQGKKEDSFWRDVQKMKKQIQAQVIRVFSKAKINKKDILKISNNYQKIIQDIQTNFRTQKPETSSHNRQDTHQRLKDIQNRYQTATMRRRNSESIETRGNLGLTLGINLENLRRMNIPDYADEFMSHYDHLSQSWKRDLQIQKRY